MAPRPGVTDWWARGRAQGVRDAARALDSTAWYRVPMPLPACRLTGHGSWPAMRPGSRTAWSCPVQPDPSYDPVPDLAALLRVLHWARPIGLAYPGSAADLHDRAGEITDFPAQIWQA